MKENFHLQFYAWNCSAISVTAALLFDCFDTQSYQFYHYISIRFQAIVLASLYHL